MAKELNMSMNTAFIASNSDTQLDMQLQKEKMQIKYTNYNWDLNE